MKFLKNKKIAIFIGLPHHSRFLLPIAEGAKGKGAEILFFTTIQDYPFEKDLLKRGYKFRFLADYAIQSTRENIRNSMHSLLNEWSKMHLKWDGFRHWTLFEQNRSFARNIEEYFCLEELIKTERPDMFLALHEMNPWGKQIGHLSMKYGIPYVTLQEGEYYTDVLCFTGHTEYSTANLLWGETTMDMLVRWKSSPDKIVIIGNTHIDDALRRYSSPLMRKNIKEELNIDASKKVVSFLVDIEWGAVLDENVWHSLLNGLEYPDIVCVFKWHPNVSYDSFKKIESIIKEKLPSSIVFYTFDPYKILSISDYCIVFGKTTLGVEAIAFGKPLFAFPTIREGIVYYAELGIAQQLSLGNWEPLFNTIKDGIPEEIKKNVDEYLNKVFYKLDGKAVERAVEVISYILECKRNNRATEQQSSRTEGQKELQKGRVSFIILSGNDPEALLSTITSLSQNVRHSDWETVIVVNDENIKEMLSGISGDIRIVYLQGDNLSLLYNKGAEASTGEYLIFIKPGIVYFKDEGLIDAAKDGVAGIALKNPDMTPYCLGIGFDFNFAPFFIKDDAALNAQRSTPDAVGGGLIGMHSRVYESIGGFDEGIANHLTEADICLSAKDKGYSVKYLPDCLGFVFKETFINEARGNGQEAIGTDSEGEWKTRIRFFAKWCGKLPKDDDYIKFAGDLLKV